MTEGKEPSAEALDAAKDAYALYIEYLKAGGNGNMTALYKHMALGFDAFALRSRLPKMRLDFSEWCVDPWSDALEGTATLHVSPDGPLAFSIKVESKAFEEVARQIIKESIETFLSSDGLWAKLETEGVRISSDEMGKQQADGFLIPWVGSPGYQPMFDVTTTGLAERLLDILADQYDAWGREEEAEVLRSVEPSQWVPEETEPAEDV